LVDIAKSILTGVDRDRIYNLAEILYEYHMIPNKTLVHGSVEQKQSKQMTVNRWSYKALIDFAGDKIQKFTKSMAFYECLMMHNSDVSDALDDAEELLNNQLEYHGIDVDKIDSVKRFEIDEGIEQLEQNVRDNDDTDFKPDDRQSGRDIWLPKFVFDGVSWSRGWSGKMDEYVAKTYASAYHDRQDRMDCKQDLIDFLDSNKTPSHRVARAIAYDTGDFVDLTPAHHSVSSDVESGWWEDIDELSELKDNAEKIDIKQDKEVRLAILQQGADLWYSERDMIAEKPLIDYATVWFGISEDYAESHYIPELDLEYDDETDEIKEAKDQVVNASTEDEVIAAVENIAEYEIIPIGDLLKASKRWDIDFEGEEELREWVYDNTDAKVPVFSKLQLKD